MGRNKDITPRKRAQIAALLQNSDMSVRQIGRTLSVSHSAVVRAKKRLEFQGTTSPRRKGRCGPKRKTSAETDRWLVRHVQKNRRRSSKQLAVDLQERNTTVSSVTVRRRLLEAGLRSYRPLKKPRLTPAMEKGILLLFHS